MQEFADQAAAINKLGGGIHGTYFGGNCPGCYNCYGVCPDNTVIKLGKPGEDDLIDLDYCKGCGLCVCECPSGAIQMVPEEI